MLHTTFIPYREFENVLGISGIDEYIRYGGTMSLSGINYNEHSIFSNKESTDAYVDSAIAKNIQHSLKYYQNAGHFRKTEDCYEKNELTSVINRVVEDINHRFTLSVLIDDFVSHDLGLSARNLLRAWCAFAHSVMRTFALSHSSTFMRSRFPHSRVRAFVLVYAPVRITTCGNSSGGTEQRLERANSCRRQRSRPGAAGCKARRDPRCNGRSAS